MGRQEPGNCRGPVQKSIRTVTDLPKDMGSFFSSSTNENIRRNQEFLMEEHKVQLERQIHMRSQIREREVALHIAKERELVYWFGAFYLISTSSLIAAFRRNPKPSLLVPILPMTFIMLYQVDLAYGSKLHRIRCEAENIVEFESPLTEMPFGNPTFNSIEEGREDQRERESLKKTHDIFL